MARAGLGCGGPPCANRAIAPAPHTWCSACHPLGKPREGMAMTIVDRPRPVTGGVDTHLDLNVVAALDALGGLLGVAEFPTTSSGHAQLLAWLKGFGPRGQGRRRGHELVRGGPGPAPAGARRRSGGGRPAQPPVPPAHRQVRPGRRHRSSPGGTVGPRPRGGQGQRRQRGSDKGAGGGQALGPLDQDQDPQPDPQPRLHRAPTTCGSS